MLFAEAVARAIGIDLGTTNCCVAFFGDNGPQVLEDAPDENGVASRLIPSFVAVQPDGDILVGREARNEYYRAPGRVIYGAKRFIGTSFDSEQVQEIMKTVPYQIVSGPEAQAVVRVGQHTLSPEDVAEHLLTYIRRRATDALMEPIEDAVITVPAHFNDRQRKATKRAGERAGLNVIALINEPTAAAMAFGYATNLSSTIAVYDLGGGTFDISILQITDGDNYEVKATAGDTFLGGADFDNRLVVHLVRNNIVPYTKKELDPISMLALRAVAEIGKIELSANTEATIALDKFLDLGTLRIPVTRSELEKMTRDLVTRTIDVCKQALADSGLERFGVKSVILVGGQTRMPFVRETVRGFFQRDPVTSMNPDVAVAAGAALHAHNLSQKPPPMALMDVTPLTLGIAIAGDRFSAIISRNTPVPCAAMRTFTTVSDNQSEVLIAVCQGEDYRASSNHFLGQLVLKGIPPAERFTPKIDVTFEFDTDGILHVSAKDQATGQAQEIVLRDTFDKAALLDQAVGTAGNLPVEKPDD